MARRRGRQIAQNTSEMRPEPMPVPIESAVPAPAIDAAQVLDAVAALWTKVKPTMLERVTCIEDATLSLMEGILEEQDRRAAEREAHKMAGAVGTFGFAGGSRTAREIELLLGSPTKLTYSDALRLADLVVELRRQLEGAPLGQGVDRPSAHSHHAGDHATLLVIGAEADLTSDLEAEAAARGLSLIVSESAVGATKWCAYEHVTPSVILFDLDHSTPLDAIAELVRRFPHVPILALTEHASFDERAQIARYGARYLLAKPQTARKLVEAASQTLLTHRSTLAHVLVVDDDPEQLALLDTLLTPNGLILTLVDNPRRFWETLEETQPDLIIFDLDMPEFSGLDLCRMLRTDPLHEGLPVLFLTVRSDPEVIEEIFAAGADDYVPKPVIGPELLTRISNRLERAQLRRETVETDPLTGLANRHRAEMAFDQFFRIAARQSVPVSLVTVEIDRFAQLAELHSSATADQVLRQLAHLMVERFRGHDVASRWEDDRFVVGMFGASRDIAVLRLTQILQAFQARQFVDGDGEAFTATFSAGIAEFPGDGKTLPELLRSTEDALGLAKAAGTAQVVPSGWVGEPRLVDHTVDVALIDDDSALASLLLHALGNRGYRTEWYQDGEAAVRALAGSESRVQAQVILLDVGLPALDGFDVLRRLVDAGVTTRTRIIMLTAHTSESEVLQALEVGAFDHVAKPFSSPVLLQRIRRAMRG